MNAEIILLVNGFSLSFLLLVLLIVLASQANHPRKKIRVSDDLRKIKAQIDEKE